MPLDYRFRPLDDRTWLGDNTTVSRFTATWADTRVLLDREVSFLLARDAPPPVLMLDITEADLRLDGTPRANTHPATGAVALAFDSTRGPLIFRCDRYTTAYRYQGPAWQHNVRAIALTLESLRAVDRYGATEHGEQYRGFRSLPAAPHMTDESAIEVITRAAGATPADWTPAARQRILGKARRCAHPDVSGSRAQWDLVHRAAAHLGLPT